VANPEQVQRMAAEIEEAYGSLDLLVANASNGYIGPSSEIAPEHWERGFTTNVVGLHRCAVEAARLMALRPQGTRGGRIVALSTVASQRYLQDFMVQGVLKSAVETLVRYLAVELGGSGITVNAIAGGPVYGELIERFPNSAERVRHWEAITPTGKLVSPDEVSRMVEFLADEHMSSVNGAIWALDGGVSLGIDARLGALDPLAREKWMQVA
jgi:NAD(P)-dependent dehydrogenase (short-subunit alcohol dehydrogenase family)